MFCSSWWSFSELDNVIGGVGVGGAPVRGEGVVVVLGVVVVVVSIGGGGA